MSSVASRRRVPTLVPEIPPATTNDGPGAKGGLPPGLLLHSTPTRPFRSKGVQLLLQIDETRPVLQSEPVQDGEVGLVDAVQVAGNSGRRDLLGVVVADVEHVIAFM